MKQMQLVLTNSTPPHYNKYSNETRIVTLYLFCLSMIACYGLKE